MENKPWERKTPLSPMAPILLAISFSFLLASVSPSSVPSTFHPQDDFLIDCGSNTNQAHSDGREFVSEKISGKYLLTKNKNIIVSSPSANVPSPIYLSARVFVDEAIYVFRMTQPGWHWVRLHFFPLDVQEYDLKNSKFSVMTDSLVLIHEFTLNENNAKEKAFYKEFLINITTERFSLRFVPSKDSITFVNAIEVVSAPDMLVPETGSNLFPVSTYENLSYQSYQTVYRINMGGPKITSWNDTLAREWDSDEPFRKENNFGKAISVSPEAVNFPKGGSPLIAPRYVYASAVILADSNSESPNFNVTWDLDIDLSFTYLVRLHFCDIFSLTLNDLYFNVYINEKIAISGMDLSTLTEGLSTAYFKDFVVNSSMVSSSLTVQIGPFNQGTGAQNAIINGLEVFKMNNSIGSFDGEFGVDGKPAAGGVRKSTVAAVGFAMMFGAFVGLGAMALKWQKRPQDWQKSNSFSSWLLPLHAGDTSFLSSKNSLGSRTSQFFSSTGGLGRYFSLSELTEATKNWDKNAIIGVGGFGNVYIGEIDNGLKVAVKRGNPQSEQGITEFQTEIQMLSKLRHRHLVSLIGYCDENAEMILVYEYMSNGPLRDHLYGKSLPPLPWRQRLEICIGSARGLHYLHTGTAQGIIHRDVKTTNILLDEAFVAKMADFGLSKDVGMGQAHVSTAVKGSFGYLDPEYFRKQQLTEKSDVYSFGVVLFEVLCARPAINPALPREQVNLAEWAMQWKRKGLLDKIIDPKLIGNINIESMTKFAEAAEKCLADYGVDRPSMGDVLWNLEHALQLQEGSIQEKLEDENKGFSGEGSLVMPPAADDHRQVALPEQGHIIDDRSGTSMVSQFNGTLSGR